ncbi:MAG: NUDIX domain-containing protein [Patescibacteria group bacterium]|nr:NUDIX domain-containing protein [Patescibacteria group bacterium]
MTDRPKIGIGVFVMKNGKFIMMLRQRAHGAGDWGLPGGHLEMNESWEDCAVRETQEETGVAITNVRFLAATNDIFGPDKHYVTIFMLADWAMGVPKICEPEKCSSVKWFTYSAMPANIFLPLKNLRTTLPDLRL